MSARGSWIPVLGALALLTILAIGCAQFGAFTFSEESDEIEVQGHALSDFLDDFPIAMDINLQQRLEEQDATGARSVYLDDLYFEMTENTEEENFDFLNEIEIYADSENQPRELLAERESIPEGQDRFELEIDDELDLKPYAEEGVELETEVNGSPPSNDARFKVYAEFRVHIL